MNKANSIGAISQAQFDSLNYSHTIFGCIGPWVTGHPRGNDYGIIELGAYGLDTHLPNGMQEITYTNGDRYYRKAVNGSISRWFKIATATPPEWHNAPLETGWSWTSQGKYGKDGSGKGYLIGVVNKASVPTSGEAILRLPAGFRPPALWPVSFSSARGTDGSSWATYGYLWPDGYLKFHGGALPANYSLNQGIAFAAEFPAV